MRLELFNCSCGSWYLRYPAARIISEPCWLDNKCKIPTLVTKRSKRNNNWYGHSITNLRSNLFFIFFLVERKNKYNKNCENLLFSFFFCCGPEWHGVRKTSNWLRKDSNFQNSRKLLFWIIIYQRRTISFKDTKKRG